MYRNGQGSIVAKDHIRMYLRTHGLLRTYSRGSCDVVKEGTVFIVLFSYGQLNLGLGDNSTQNNSF